MNRSKKRIAIFVENTAEGYSGGRYHAWMMAEGLAQAGYETYCITNCRPAFYGDFDAYPFHRNLRIVYTADFFSDLPGGQFDAVIVVPGMGWWPEFYFKVRLFTLERRGRLALLNFETPNWFNLYSPKKRNPVLWRNWMETGGVADLIICSTLESSNYAEEYYRLGDERKFVYCYPPINSKGADAVHQPKRENRIVLFARIDASEHKGIRECRELLCDSMKGYSFVIIWGRRNIPKEFTENLEKAASNLGIKLIYRFGLSDREKFEELKKAKLVLFPSFFEGFGLPPVEAQYCNVPCIAFDLPVLREVNGDALLYVDKGDWAGMRRKINEVLADPKNFGEEVNFKNGIEGVASFDEYSKRIGRIMDYLTFELPPVVDGEEKVTQLRAIKRKMKILNYSRPLWKLFKFAIKIYRDIWKTLS